MGADPLCAKAGPRVGQASGPGVRGHRRHRRPRECVRRTAGHLPERARRAARTRSSSRQRGCVYSPRVVGIRVGQALRLVNADTLLHNLHGVSTKNNGFNETQPQSGSVNNFVMKAPETMLHVTCDVHSWMSAWVGVEPHPYFAVSGADGSFTIANVPAGRRTIRAWQERYGWITRTIDVKAGRHHDGRTGLYRQRKARHEGQRGRGSRGNARLLLPIGRTGGCVPCRAIIPRLTEFLIPDLNPGS